MFFLFGIGSNRKDLGLFSNIPCLFCSDRHPMRLCKHYRYFHIFFIPVVHFDVTYSLTCPDCSAIYILDKEKAKRLRRDSSVRVEASDMSTVSKAVRRCKNCGAYVQFDDAFCSKCGAML